MASHCIPQKIRDCLSMAWFLLSILTKVVPGSGCYNRYKWSWPEDIVSFVKQSLLGDGLANYKNGNKGYLVSSMDCLLIWFPTDAAIWHGELPAIPIHKHYTYLCVRVCFYMGEYIFIFLSVLKCFILITFLIYTRSLEINGWPGKPPN